MKKDKDTGLGKVLVGLGILLLLLLAGDDVEAADDEDVGAGEGASGPERPRLLVILRPTGLYLSPETEARPVSLEAVLRAARGKDVTLLGGTPAARERVGRALEKQGSRVWVRTPRRTL